MQKNRAQTLGLWKNGLLLPTSSHSAWALWKMLPRLISATRKAPEVGWALPGFSILPRPGEDEQKAGVFIPLNSSLLDSCPTSVVKCKQLRSQTVSVNCSFPEPCGWGMSILGKAPHPHCYIPPLQHCSGPQAFLLSIPLTLGELRRFL